MRITPFTRVVTLTADRTVDKTDHDTFFVCDTDEAGGDIAITVDEALVGVRMIFRKKGTGGNVTFGDGSPSTGVTLNHQSSAVIATEDGVVELIYDEDGTTATLYGDLAAA